MVDSDINIITVNVLNRDFYLKTTLVIYKESSTNKRRWI